MNEALIDAAREMREAKLKRDKAMCYGKSRYDSDERANKYRKKAENQRGVKLRIYSCPVCMGYHLTKQHESRDS